MNAATANQIYDVLVATCEAPESMRADFVHVQTTEFCKEWRFQGELGFGGKFWRGRHGWIFNRPNWFVNYYPEDRTPERDAMVEEANAALKYLYEANEADKE